MSYLLLHFYLSWKTVLFVYIKLTPYGKCTQHWKLMVFSFIGFENLHPSLVLLVRFGQSSEQAKL